MIECVPNFSEGRNAVSVATIESAIASVAQTIVLHRTSDPDHNRSVITFAGSESAVIESAVRAAIAAASLIDLTQQSGVHPRLGALDVLPFVPLADATLEDCVRVARKAGERIWKEAGVPVYYYGVAALRPDRVALEDVRRGQFEGIRDAVKHRPECQPDVGGPHLHPTAGAVIVGARKFLIAYNINLQSNDLRLAKHIARQIRSSSGGLPCVKALGLSLPSRAQVQVSMNLTDFGITGIDAVFAKVSQLAAQAGVFIAESELIGLLPREALEQAAARLLKLRDFDTLRVIENRLARSEKQHDDGTN